MTTVSPSSDRAVGADALSGRVARGAAWIFGASLCARVLGVLNTIIVARLLAPDDIGLIAVSVGLMQLLQGLSDIGVSQAVVKFQRTTRTELDTLFTLSVIRGVAVAAILFAGAPVAADIYGDPRMFWAFAGIAAFPLIAGFFNPRFYEFERALRFSKEFLSTIASKLAGVAVSVGIAVVFRSYWAIILGLLAGGVVQLCLSYALRPYMPRFGFGAIRRVFALSGWLTGVSFLSALNNKLDAPILARAAGAGGAGFYYMGVQLSELAANQIAAPFARSVYPGLSGLQHDPARMRSAYLRSIEALSIVVLPVSFGLSFVAGDAVLLLLGEQWRTVGPFLTILAPALGLQALFAGTHGYAVAMGRVRALFFRELIFFAIRAPVFIWAALAHGLEGAVWAAAGLSLAHVLLNLGLYAKASGRSFFEPVLAARRAFGAIAGMSALLFLVRAYAPIFEGAPLLVRLCVDIGMGALAYFGVYAALWAIAGRPDGLERELFFRVASQRTSVSNLKRNHQL